MSETNAMQPARRGAAMVLFSGGQDSTTCLAWALSRFERVETLGFDYGQRHAVELECRKTVLEKLRAFRPEWVQRLGEDHMLDMGLLGQISDCALTREQELRFMENNIPNTFVPARNLLFFTFAAALAYRRGIETLVGGMCETDYSGYADCRGACRSRFRLASMRRWSLRHPSCGSTRLRPGCWRKRLVAGNWST